MDFEKIDIQLEKEVSDKESAIDEIFHEIKFTECFEEFQIICFITIH